MQPGQPFALVGRAVALADMGQDAAAVPAIAAARAAMPDSAALLERALAVAVRLSRYPEALAASDALLRQRPHDAALLATRADVLKALRRPEEAAQCMGMVVRLQPDYPRAVGNLLRTRALCADWRDREALEAHVRAKVREGADADAPFSFLALSDDPAEQLACARTAAHGMRLAPAAAPAAAQRGARLRIGYLSADYENHPTLHLLVGVFERHDRSRFDIVGLSLGPRSNHPLRARCEAAFETFVDLHGLPDAELAAALRAQALDVLVDLNGFTNGSRVDVLAARVAPVQAGYLGYPGTMAGAAWDYLLADAVVVPQGERPHYAEAVVRLPGCYQANDDRRETAPAPSRAALGLPEAAFVYACFNHTYKVTPATFASWMRILQAVPGSMLWLLEDNAAATRNLRAHAAAYGIDAQRLAFAPRVPTAEHLARHACADLVLDTLPYNAHTTASDALWMGVPVLTLPGRAFAARVAASLLHALHLPELVCASAAEYEARAIGLARDAGALRALRQKLAANRLRAGGPFDTAGTARALEAAYAAMAQQHRGGMPPADITL